MPFSVGCGYFPATISNRRIEQIVRSETPPEISNFSKIKDFFCLTHRSEALECIRKICHPPEGTTPDDVKNRFEQLKALAYPGYAENVQCNRNGTDHFCILDENSKEILSVTISVASYTVECEWHSTSHLCDASITKQSRSAQEYETIWSAWENKAPWEEVNQRRTAVEQMRDCLRGKAPKLDLMGLNLTSLPEILPEHITTLYCANNKLSALPQMLPAGLQILSAFGNRLTTLPETLPTDLKKLHVGSNTLITLPKTLPAGLTELRANANELIAVPDTLPGRLRLLAVSRNQLTALPETLPAGLQVLHVDHNQLTALLESFPVGLRILSIDHNNLTVLPEKLPDELTMIDASYNRLAELPTSIMRIPRIIEIKGNPLSEQTIQRIQTVINEPGYQGAQITFSISDDSSILSRFRAPQNIRPPEFNRTLYHSVTAWLMSTAEEAGDRWMAIEKEENAAAFGDFLHRLRCTKDNLKNPEFQAQVSDWLTRLADDCTLREKIFAVAMDATASCEDRITLTYNQMQAVELTHVAGLGAFDQKLPDLISAGREMFRLEQLEQIARTKVKTLNNADEIEVYLGYQNRLRKPLKLTTTTKEMQYFDYSEIKASDLRSAKKQVKIAEKEHFRVWLAQWAPWQKVLERTAPQRWEEAMNKRADIYEKEFDKRVRARMAAVGLSGDADAERAIGLAVMDEINRTIFNALADEVLVDKKGRQLLRAQKPTHKRIWSLLPSSSRR